MRFCFPPFRCKRLLLFLLSAASLRAEFPLYTVTTYGGGFALNNKGEVLRDGFSSGSPSYVLYQAPNGSVIGTLSEPPPGWDGISFRRSTVTDMGSTVLEVFKQTGLGVLDFTSEVAIGNVKTGQFTVIQNTPVNGDDDRNQILSPNEKYVAIQAGPGPGPGQLQPFRYDAVNGWVPLGNLFVGGDGRPLGVNSTGTVVGRSLDASGNNIPFIYSDGVGMEGITNGGSPLSGEAKAINENGLVTGTANGRAFVFNSSTMEFEFITPEVGLRAVDINNAGAIIGTNGGGGITGAAFYWDKENGLTGFDNLIGTAIDDWFITDALDINDEGWVLATAFNRGTSSNSNVLLRPVPEPSSMLLAGISCLWFMSRHRPGKESRINGGD